MFRLASAESLADESSCERALSVPGLESEALSLGFEPVVIEAVFDGDTVLLVDGRKIRVIGVNTPELGHHGRPVEPLAKEAKQRLIELLRGSALMPSKKDQSLLAWIKVGGDEKDHYGRTLAHLFSRQGVNVTYWLLKEGLGFQVAIPPNLWGTDCYYFAQDVAKNAQKGVWGNVYYDPSMSTQKDLRGGYQRITGKIEKLFVTKRAIWIDLQGQVTLKLDQRDSDFLQGTVLKRVLDSSEKNLIEKLPSIEVNGWFIDRERWGQKMAARIQRGERHRWLLNLRHRSQWHFDGV